MLKKPFSMNFRHGLTSIASEKYFWTTAFLFIFSFILVTLLFRKDRVDYASLNYTLQPSPSDSRMAICLVGGLRMFELTAPSIQSRLLSAYPYSDVFVVSPADEDSWKLWLINGSNVVAANVYQQSTIPEDDYIKKLIHPYAAQGSRQGLLHYSMLVESCKQLIMKYELIHKFQYKWVLRARPDALWSEKLPSLDSVSLGEFYIPPGSDYWGINDRFSLGNREASLKSLSWISSIPPQAEEGSKFNLTSEEKFQALLEFTHINEIVVRKRFPFCILTRRWFFHPPDFDKPAAASGVIAPISAPDFGDGRYCKPCKPVTDSNATKEATFEKFHTQEFCYGSVAGFEEGWEEIFDSTTGPVQTEIRKSFASKSNFCTCISVFSDFINRVEIWEGRLSAYDLCTLAFNDMNSELEKGNKTNNISSETGHGRGKPWWLKFT